MHESSEGRKAERISPVPFWIGLPVPLLSRVSVLLVV